MTVKRLARSYGKNGLHQSIVSPQWTRPKEEIHFLDVMVYVKSR